MNPPHIPMASVISLLNGIASDVKRLLEAVAVISHI